MLISSDTPTIFIDKLICQYILIYAPTLRKAFPVIWSAWLFFKADILQSGIAATAYLAFVAVETVEQPSFTHLYTGTVGIKIVNALVDGIGQVGYCPVELAYVSDGKAVCKPKRVAYCYYLLSDVDVGLVTEN